MLYHNQILHKYIKAGNVILNINDHLRASANFNYYEELRNLRAIKYKNGILLLEIYDKLPLNNIEDKDLRGNWKMCIKSMNLDMNQFHIGINDSVMPIPKNMY